MPRKTPCLALLGVALASTLIVGCGTTTSNAAPSSSAADLPPPTPRAPGAFQESDVVREAEEFFGSGAEGLGQVIHRAFSEHGEPQGIIRGTEGGGAIAIGLRYGEGTLRLADGTSMPVYWNGPSIGFDIGGNAAKTLILVYDPPAIDAFFQRYPGVEGSLYFVGGVGLNYNRSGNTVLAPVRFGVGWRQGASVGYLKLTREPNVNPF